MSSHPQASLTPPPFSAFISLSSLPPPLSGAPSHCTSASLPLASPISLSLGLPSCPLTISQPRLRRAAGSAVDVKEDDVEEASAASVSTAELCRAPLSSADDLSLPVSYRYC